MSSRHPSRQRLQRWLETGETRRVSNHIDDCEHCQEVLEEISALDEGLVADLQTATTPPDDLRERTHGGVDQRLRDEAAFGSFLDLFTIGFDVARCILDADMPAHAPPLTDPAPTTQGDDAHGTTHLADEQNGDSR